MHQGPGVSRHWQRLHLLFSVVLVAVILLFSTVLRDRLLFKTDFANLVRFLVSTTILVFVLLAPLLLLLRRRSDSSRAGRGLARTLLFLIGYGFVVNAIDNAHVWPADTWLKLAVVHAVAVASALLLVRLAFVDVAVQGRLRLASTAMSLCALAALVIAVVMTLPSGGNGSGNVVLLVVDGLPAWGLREYHPEQPVALPTLTQISSDFRLFTEVRTNFVFTYGYFDALLSGREEGCIRGQPNLFSALQDHGVTTSWIVSHLNASPDSHAARNYRGFRSSVITHRLSWLPRILGLNYNLYRSPELRDGLVVSWLHESLQQWLPPRRSFAADIVAEVDRLHRGRRPFLLMVHAFPTFEFTSPRKLWRPLDGTDERDRVEKLIRKADYAFTPEQEWLVEEWRQRLAIKVTKAVETVADIAASLDQRGILDDTTVILTADHGYILDRGRVFYGFHPDEEVAQVPMVLFGRGHAGIDHRLGGTVDLSQTLLELFGVSDRFNPTARSLLGPEPAPVATTLTGRSRIRGEHFLSLYRRGADTEIIRLTVDLEDSTTCQLATATGGVLTPIECLPLTPGSELAAEVEAALDRYRGGNGELEAWMRY